MVTLIAETQMKFDPHFFPKGNRIGEEGKLEFNSFLHFEQQHDVLNETLSVVMKLHLHDYV